MIQNDVFLKIGGSCDGERTMSASENRENLIGIGAGWSVDVRQGIPQMESVALADFDQRLRVRLVVAIVITEDDVGKRGLDRVEKSIG